MKWTPRLMMAAVFVLSIVLVASSAMAQPGGGRGGRGGAGGPGGPGGRGGPGGMMGGGPGGMMRGGGGVMGLLRAEVVRAEVGINESMVEEIRNVAREAMQGGGGFEAFRGLRDLPEEERRAKMEELRAQMEERGKAMEKKMAEVIGMEKFGRLKEIELQMAGVQAISRPDVAAYLGLTEEQKQKIQELRTASSEAGRAQMESVVPGGFGAMREMSEEDRRAAFEKMRTMREEAQKKLEKDVMAVLTDEQKKKLGEMMGEPFAKMDELREQMRGGFMGRGGPGGQGRGGFQGRGGEGRGRGGEGRGDRGDRGAGRRQRPT